MTRCTIKWLGTLVSPLVLVGAGCSSGQADDDFVNPAGFTPQQTSRTALSANAFVSSDGVISTTTAAGRAPWKTLGGTGAIEAIMLGTYRDGVRVASTSHGTAWVDVVPASSPAAATGRVRRDGAIVTFEHVFPGVTSAFGATPMRVEEFLSVDKPEHFPTLSYHLIPREVGRWSKEDDGSYYAFSTSGAAMFALRPPTVEDANNKVVQGTWTMTPETGGGQLVTASFDLTGLVYPLLVDPTFETPTWTPDTANQPGGLAAPAAAWDPTSACAVIFGGAKDSYVVTSEVRLHCATGWQAGDATGAGTTPSARAYSAMSQGPSYAGTARNGFVFGGTDVNGQLLDDMWALKLTGSNPRVATWTSIPAPSPKTATNWPSARIMHGMSKDANGHIVLWGGVDTAGNVLSDTWIWSGSAWSKVTCPASGVACFPGSYGFAAIQSTAADTSAYAIGGYAGGAFTNAVYSWNGTTWATVTTKSADIPTDRYGALLTSSPAGSVSPLARYVGFAARTNTNSFLFGSGVTFDAMGADVYQQDLWMLPSSPSGAKWVSISTADATFDPGTRESPAAVYEESRGQTLLFGGGTSATSNSVTQSSRIYAGRSDTTTMLVRQNGTGYDLAAFLVYGSGISSTGVEGYFVARDGSGVWHPISATCGTSGVPNTAPFALPSPFPSIPATIFCTATASALSSLTGLTGFGVRMRDHRALPIALCGGFACNPFDGVATCAVPTSSSIGCGALP